jgi:hypothetical protein
MCRQLTLQTCSHPIRSSSPTLVGNRNRRKKRTAGNDEKIGDGIATSASFDAETDHSAGVFPIIICDKSRINVINFVFLIVCRR